MKLIDIEGLDGCGKGIQSVLLKNYYDFIGKKATVLQFPSIGTTTGDNCVEFQRGKYGNPLNASPIFSSLLYAMDRTLFFNEPGRYDEICRNNDYLICDRYKMSNLICNLHKFKTDEDKKKYISFMATAESNIPQEDITIFLAMPLEMNTKLIGKRNRDSSDMNESIEAQAIFRSNAQWIFNNKDYIEWIWSDKYNYKLIVIDCCSDNKLLTPEEIRRKIVSEIIHI